MVALVKGYANAKFPLVKRKRMAVKRLGGPQQRRYPSSVGRAIKLVSVFAIAIAALCPISLYMIYHETDAAEHTTDLRHSLRSLQVQSEKLTVSPGGVKVSNGILHQQTTKPVIPQDYLASCRSSVKCCDLSIHNPGDTIDIVIPYRVRPVTDMSLMYELRSFEKSGLLDHVGSVFIIAETKEDVEIIESRYQAYITRMKNLSSGKNQFRVVAMSDIKVPFVTEKFKNVKLAKSHYSPYLPLTSEYYLLVPDDVIMLRNYTRDIWFDQKKQLPYAHSFGGYRVGNTRGFPNIAEMHGVNFLNRCSMRFAIEKYNVSDPEQLSPTAAALGLMRKEHLLAQFYSYASSAFTKVGPYNTVFFRECHTNGGCIKPRFSSIFVNVQGNGINDEYPKNEKLGRLFGDWFRTTFPIPSRFE